MSHPQAFAQDETPRQLFAGHGEVHTVIVHNPDGAAAVFVKLYHGNTAPTGSSVPAVSMHCPSGGSIPYPVFADFAGCWIAAATEGLAGLTAPSTDPIVTVVTG